MSETVAVVRASRPNFLVLAPLCAGLGVAVAWHQGEPPALLNTLLVLIGALLAHAAVNLLNEYEDFASGLDLITRRTPFSGGSGALPEVPTAARQVLLAAFGTLGLVVAIGLYFLWLRGLPMLVLGAAGVVLGARLDATALTVSTIGLLLVSELLLINQIPDADADRKVGRRHLVITLGKTAAARLVGLLLLGSYGILEAAIWIGWLPLWTALAFAPLPAAIWISVKLPGALNRPEQFNTLLGINVGVLLATLALLICGLSL